VAVKASDNGKKYVELGRIYTPADVDPAVKQTYYFAFPKAVKAKHLQVYFSSQEGRAARIVQLPQRFLRSPSPVFSPSRSFTHLFTVPSWAIPPSSCMTREQKKCISVRPARLCFLDANISISPDPVLIMT
jgi:hypothetical protein